VDDPEYCLYRRKRRAAFWHVQHFRPNRGPHRLENVGQQCDIFWPVRASLWRVATFKSLLGATRHSLAWTGGDPVGLRCIAKSKIYDVAYNMIDDLHYKTFKTFNLAHELKRTKNVLDGNEMRKAEMKVQLYVKHKKSKQTVMGEIAWDQEKN